MSWPRIAFVDAPVITATVRYDLNRMEDKSAPRKVVELDLGTPSLAGDPDLGGVYGTRSPSLTHRIFGTKPAALAAQSALARELLRSENWLLYQQSVEVRPIWLRLYPTAPGGLSLARVAVNPRTGESRRDLQDAWDIQVPLLADAFARGERVTVPTATLTQSPSATNPMRVMLPTIKGDAPAPLRVSVAPSAASASAASPVSQWLIGCISGKTGLDWITQEVGASDGFTVPAGQTAPTAGGSAYFGSSFRRVTVDTTLATRFGGALGNFAILPQGRFKVELRCQTSTDTDATLRMRLRQRTTQTQYTEVIGDLKTIYLAAGDSLGTGGGTLTRRFWVDLGEVNLPLGSARVPTDVGLVAAYSNIYFDAAVDTGTLSLGVDAIRYIPVDGPLVTSAELLTLTGPAASPLRGQFTGVFDSDTESYWGFTGASVIDGSNTYQTLSDGAPVLRGGFPTADPAAAVNMLIVMAVDNGKGIGGNSSTTDIAALGAAADVTVSYQPRLLYLGDGT